MLCGGACKCRECKNTEDSEERRSLLSIVGWPDAPAATPAGSGRRAGGGDRDDGWSPAVAGARGPGGPARAAAAAAAACGGLDGAEAAAVPALLAIMSSLSGSRAARPGPGYHAHGSRAGVAHSVLQPSHAARLCTATELQRLALAMIRAAAAAAAAAPPAAAAAAATSRARVEAQGEGVGPVLAEPAARAERAVLSLLLAHLSS